jgi:lysozyme
MMSPLTRDKLRELLIHQEEMRLKPYTDKTGHITIGVGRNLDQVGIGESEALFLLENDMSRVFYEAEMSFPWLKDLNPTRQLAVFSMLFNLGLPRMLGFHQMIEALAKQDFATATKEMLNSQWATQVPNRATELAVMMKLGR